MYVFLVQNRSGGYVIEPHMVLVKIDDHMGKYYDSYEEEIEEYIENITDGVVFF